MKEPDEGRPTAQIISLMEREDKEDSKETAEHKQRLTDTLATALQEEQDLLLVTIGTDGSLMIQTNMESPSAFSLCHLTANVFLDHIGGHIGEG